MTLRGRAPGGSVPASECDAGDTGDTESELGQGTVVSTPRQRGADQAAGRYLEELLAHDPRYRRVWQRKSDRRSARGVNRTAVARVLMSHLNTSGEAAVDDERQLLDRVRRALSGQVLEPRTLQWFVDAFGLHHEHEEELRDLLAGGRPPQREREAVVGPEPPPRSTPWRTVSLHEFHMVGPDQIPAWHETFLVIEALEDGLDHYPYTFDTAEVDIDVVWGGRREPLERLDETWCRARIRFDEPLHRGQTKSLRFVTRFHYAEPPEPCYRRGASQRVDNVELRVQFDAGQLPRQVWWCRWDDLDAAPAETRPRELDADHSVGCVHTSLQNTVVGFWWQW